MSTPEQHDVVILGGGLAGLTLALQLRQRMPDLDVLVLERRAHPVPLAAHKVGESTVEIGAHYFADVLGLREHLQHDQLKKFGFRFFFSDGRCDIDQVTELGASVALPTGSFQIDRGMFENMLGERVRAAGITFLDGAMVRDFALAPTGPRGAVAADALHTVRYEHAGQAHEAGARWLIDASGRAGLLKRRLDLAEPNGHEAGSVWFRIADRLDVDDWSDDADWLARCEPRSRWRSTNHLVGDGYWVWLIPLASGSHSVGVVADGRMHPIESMNDFDKCMDWLAVHQPRLHRALEARRDKLQDFAFFRRFSYACKRMWSGAQRWAITGEAGVFLDPFYSPGSDFIAIANTYVTELVAHDRARRPVQMFASMYEQIFFTLYRNMLPLYIDQYPMFGNAQVMPVKVIWDYTFYWGVMCTLFFQGRLTDLQAMARVQKRLAGIEQLNVAVQAFMREWSAVSGRDNPPRMLDQASLGWFAELNRGLTDRLDAEGFDLRIEQASARLESLALEIVERALAAHPQLDAAAVRAALPAQTLREPLLFAA